MDILSNIKPYVLIFHFIGLAMGLGTSFAMMVLGRSAAGLSQEDRKAFMLKVMALRKLGSLGFTLLLVTGLLMLFSNWDTYMIHHKNKMLFHIKIGLFLLLIPVFGYQQMIVAKVLKNSGGPLMKVIPKVGMIMQFIVLVIVILAVLTFNT